MRQTVAHSRVQPRLDLISRVCVSGVSNGKDQIYVRSTDSIARFPILNSCR
jgi:hypothetical protein